MTARVEYGGLTLALPDGWADVTGALPPGTPLTLARADGVGSMQCSAARHRSGPVAKASLQDLRDLVAQFGPLRGLGAARATEVGQGRSLWAWADYSAAPALTWVWYVSDGVDFAFVTYVAVAGHPATPATERAEVIAIVDSIELGLSAS